jgi:pyroglutamyl-peptidase
MKRVLLTAFEPFGGQPINPSQEVARALRSRTFKEVQLETCELPVERFKAIERALERIRSFKPDAVIMLGKASGRAKITPETIAVNRDDFHIPDISGNQPKGELIIPDGPPKFQTTLPVAEIVNDLSRAGIPAALSHDAGSYLCNRLFYSVRYVLARESPQTLAGFIHLPCLPEEFMCEEPQKPSLALETQVSALLIIIERVASSCR